MKTLYPHQTEWIMDIRNLVKEGEKRIIAQAPTGMGKTICIAELVRSMKSGTRVMIMLHRQELLFQTCAHLCDMARKRPDGSKIMPSVYSSNSIYFEAANYVRRKGEEQGEHWWIEAPNEVMVVMLPTLASRLKRAQAGKRHQPLPATRPDLIFVDEAHHACAPSWMDGINSFMNDKVVLIGVTATPQRSDGVSLMRPAGVFDKLHIGPSMQALVDNGYLARPRVFVPAAQYDRTRLKDDKMTGDFSQASMGEQSGFITGNAIDNFVAQQAEIEEDKRLPSLAFCVSVKHAEETAARFRERGYRATSIDGRMSEWERSQRIQALERRELDVLTSCDVLGEGVDVPIVGGAILLRPTKSQVVHLQQVGRAMRTAPGKTTADFYDHAGNTLMHGDMLEPVLWKPEGTGVGFIAEEKKIGLRICENCNVVNRAHRLVCMNCGEELHRKGRQLKERAGVLKISTANRVSSAGMAWGEFWGQLAGMNEHTIRAIAERHELNNDWVESAVSRLRRQTPR